MRLICECGRGTPGGYIKTCAVCVQLGPNRVMTPEELKKWEPDLSREALAIQGRRRVGRGRRR